MSYINTKFCLDNLMLKNKYKEKIIEVIKYFESNEKVVQLILFGSCARQQTHLGSDVDIMVLSEGELSTTEKGMARVMLTDDLCGVNVDLTFSDIELYNKAQDKFYLNVKREGVTIWKRT